MLHAAESRLSQEQKDARQAEIDKRAAEIALLRKDMNETFAPAHGQRVLRWLMDQCGYQSSIVSIDPHTTKILTENLIYNAARQNLYLTLRKFLHKNILVSVEHKAPGDDIDIFS